MMRSFAADVRIAEDLANSGWNVYMHPTESRVLATRGGYTMLADVAVAGRGVEDMLRTFRTEDMDRAQFEEIAYTCLEHGYTADEIDEAVDLLWTETHD